MKITPFSRKLGDLELRSTGKGLFIEEGKGHVTFEIVQWGEINKRRSCYTIAYWTYDLPEGKDQELTFVSDRPLSDDVDWDHFEVLVRSGYIKISDNKRAVTDQSWLITIPNGECEFRRLHADMYMCGYIKIHLRVHPPGNYCNFDICPRKE